MTAAFLTELQTALAAAAQAATIAHDTLVLLLAPSAVLPVATRLKEELGFDLLLDITAVDWPDDELRFEVVHHFYSTQRFVRVRLKHRLPAAAPTTASMVTLYGSAGYAERECHDMYGIQFSGNSDLRPILLYEGFVGHPLRKDYPKNREQPLVPPRR